MFIKIEKEEEKRVESSLETLEWYENNNIGPILVGTFFFVGNYVSNNKMSVIL